MINILDIFRFLCFCIVIEKGSWSPKSSIAYLTKDQKRKEKPEWLKEWTISKGWIHNRSHLLDLGKSEENDDNSSINTENVDELISLEQDLDKIEVIAPENDLSEVFEEISTNYRENFPEIHPANFDLQLPQIYKEQLLKPRNIFEEFWKILKPKRKIKRGFNCKFTVNQIYQEDDQIAKTAPKHRTNLGKNIALYNTLNSKTNLHEDPIYECSEENLSIYNNPIYESTMKYYDFHSNHICKSKFGVRKMQTEKYIIRHIKVRIMLSLRIGHFKKFRKKKKCWGKFRKTDESNLVQDSIRRAHEEQRRIGSGTNSIKIQNMRYGRLNVLRWLLWEAEFSGEMPALERATNNTTLALHYAAARGCLDCVRLLVDSTPDLSANTQMDNDVTPVYLAAQEGHLEVLKFLVLEAGGSLYVRAKDGMAPIHAASQMGCLNCVKWMIQEQGVDPNLRDGDGATPLHFAASRGHLETVRWLLKHGARLSLDKYGKSPINDAAENQQVECLNVLVQHGTTPDYKDSENTTNKSCSCARKGDLVKRGNSVASDCSNCKANQSNDNNSEPFYLHPPLGSRSLEAPHAPQDGLYINPMNNHRHSASSASDSSSNNSISGESFYLHNPQEVIYNRVKDLFENNSQRQGLSGLTVKVDVHSSSSGAGSDENLSSSDLSERSADHDHDYEDIYLVREESKQKNLQNRSRSRDSGSHSRSGSASSSNSSNIKQKEQTEQQENNARKENSSSASSEEEIVEKTKLGVRHSLPPKITDGRVLKRVTSVPADMPPPPPPPPPNNSSNSSSNATVIQNMDDEPRGAEIVEVVEEPTLKPSEIVRGMCKTMSSLTTRRLNSSCSDLTIVSLGTDTEEGGGEKIGGPNLVNKQRVLPFIPPSFPGSNSNNNLIKPSEYLKSISDKRLSNSSLRSTECEEAVMIVEEQKEVVVPIIGPPPPPLPSESTSQLKESEIKKQAQPLSAISIQDLNSVQLRRTDKMIASKTFSAPTRSMSLQCLQSEPFLAQKTDLIAELKLSKDITGIKKLKIEKAKVEKGKEKEKYTEISKQFTATKFVEKIPDKDNTGNIIPAWKRQMLAKKAAERARKELEEQIQKEAEEKRLQSIPAWKRQLLAKKEETEFRIKTVLYTPKIFDEPKTLKLHDNNDYTEEKNEDINNNENIKPLIDEEDEEPNIIPWRAQLRKTNSKLNLLD